MLVSSVVSQLWTLGCGYLSQHIACHYGAGQLYKRIKSHSYKRIEEGREREEGREEGQGRREREEGKGRKETYLAL